VKLLKKELTLRPLKLHRTIKGTVHYDVYWAVRNKTMDWIELRQDVTRLIVDLLGEQNE
jgi:hypothetical protein